MVTTQSRSITVSAARALIQSSPLDPNRVRVFDGNSLGGPVGPASRISGGRAPIGDCTMASVYIRTRRSGPADSPRPAARQQGPAWSSRSPRSPRVVAIRVLGPSRMPAIQPEGMLPLSPLPRPAGMAPSKAAGPHLSSRRLAIPAAVQRHPFYQRRWRMYASRRRRRRCHAPGLWYAQLRSLVRRSPQASRRQLYAQPT
jgi:hypothetical protein